MLVWNQVGERKFEAGVDRGVLYPLAGDPLYSPGVAWNGLTDVVDKSASDGPEEFHYDGIKYLAMPGYSDFAATIQAIMSPPEFDKHDGTLEAISGVGITQQMPVPFGFCYRTLLGDDISGVDARYRLHLIYNALATPSERANTTITNTVNLTTLSWDVTTTPVIISGFKPTAHIWVDSQNVLDLSALEDILYGAVDPPRLPLPDEVLTLMTPGFRFIMDIASPDPGLLPGSAEEGDSVFSLSDEGAYAVDSTEVSDDVRKVIVIHEGDPVPDYAVPGDVIYNEDTGELYRMTEE